jgi:hypothetical protein
MEKVTGIGGLFFRANDPAVLGRWYQEHLGVTLTPTSYDEPSWQQEAGPTVFAPFPEQTDYFILAIPSSLGWSTSASAIWMR